MNFQLDVLFIISGLRSGGAEIALARLLPEIGERNIRAEVVCLGQEGLAAEILYAKGIPVIVLDMKFGNLCVSMIRLFQAIRNPKFRLIQTWLYHADLVGGGMARLFSNKPVIWGVRNSQLKLESLSTSSRIILRLCRILATWVPTHIIACAESAKRAHVAMGYPENRSSVIFNGIDVDEFSPDLLTKKEARSHLGLSVNDFVVGHVARFDANKNHYMFLKAISLLKQKNIKILMSGRGIDHCNEALISQIDELGIFDQVLLLGEQTDMLKIYRSMDVFVSSSASEGFPNTLAEAMACGLPCVATNVGASAEILGTTEYLVNSIDAESLATSLKHCIQALRDQNPQELQRLQQNRRDRIRSQFSLSQCADKYALLYKDILDQCAV